MTPIKVLIIIGAMLIGFVASYMAGRASVTGLEINRGDRSRTIVTPEVKWEMPGYRQPKDSPFIAPGSILTADDFNRHVATVCPKAGLPTYTSGSLVTQPDMLRCIVSAALVATYTREGRQDPVTQQNPTLDPQTAAWYHMMAEKGYVPMTIMVPKEKTK